MGTLYLDELNDAQREAVVYNDGPALVIAGAGSGKTRVLVYKLLHLLYKGYDPGRLMALTFTNKAAREMRARVEAIAGPVARYIKMGTFHSIFLRILRQHAHLLGYTADFTIYNTSDTKAKIKAIMKLMDLDEGSYKPNNIHSRISRAKNSLLTPEAYRAQVDLVREDGRHGVARFVDIYTRYCHELRQNNAMDFDDLLLQTNILFRDHPDVLAQWQERIDYLLIDEYQDTNFAQYNIARMLMQERGAIFVVGDDAQSIYSFRGASIENILKFQSAFAGARLFKLEQNYRSSQTIVQAAGALIARNKNQIPKEVFSLGEVGEPIEVHEAYSGEEEAGWVCSSIERLRYTREASYSDFAVLYRTKAQSRTLEQLFRRHNIPFKIWGGRSFYDHKEIMDTLAYLRLIVNEHDDEAMLRIINYPRRGIGDTTIGRLRSRAGELGVSMSSILEDPLAHGVEVSRATATKLTAFASLIDEMRQRSLSVEGNLYDLVHSIVMQSGIMAELNLDTTSEGRERVANVKELLASIEEYTQAARQTESEISLSAYLNEIALMTDVDADTEDDAPSVTLMTIHASKGLEFAHVFIVGLEEALFPSAMSQEMNELEEERRLFYVALTRAEQTCHLGYARERFRNGRTETVRPSRFLSELPAELLKKNSSAQSTLTSLMRGFATELPTEFASVEPTPSPRSKRVHIGRRSADSPEPTVQHQQLDNLVVGNRIYHPRFGEGLLLSLEGLEANAKAVVRFDTAGEKTLLLRFAKLQPLD